MLRRALVLGAARSGNFNIGDAVAHELAMRDWRVTPHDGRDPSQPSGFGPDCVDDLVLSEADGLVISLGKELIAPLHEQDRAEMEQVIWACFAMPLVVIQRWLQARSERARKGGHCVVIGSYGADHVLSNSVAYCASKAAMEHAVRCLAWDYAPAHFVFNNVAPYHVLGTPMSERVEDAIVQTKGITRAEARQYAMKDVKMRPVNPDDIGHVVADLLEQHAGWTMTNGQTIKMYGGVR